MRWLLAAGPPGWLLPACCAARACWPLAMAPAQERRLIRMKLHLRASTASGSSGLSPPAVVAPGLRTTRPQDVSSAKQLFIDRRFVATTVGDCTLSTATPVLNPQPVLVADRPWEDGGIGAYNTVLREPDGRHRMWYHALKFLPTNLTGMPAEGACRLCIAESLDGLTWHKPSLGLVEFEGSTDNNIVGPLLERQSMQGACVYRDDKAPPAERYKLMTKFLPTSEEVAAGVEAGLWAMYSADGLRWCYYPSQPCPADTMCDTQNMLWYDDSLELWCAYPRVKETQVPRGKLANMDTTSGPTQTGISHEAAVDGGSDEANRNSRGQGRYRAMGRITSPGFGRDACWSPLEIVLEADEQELQMPLPTVGLRAGKDPRPNVDVYTSCALKYPWAADVPIYSFYYSSHTYLYWLKCNYDLPWIPIMCIPIHSIIRHPSCKLLHITPYMYVQIYLAFPSLYFHWGDAQPDFPAQLDVHMSACATLCIHTSLR